MDRRTLQIPATGMLLATSVALTPPPAQAQDAAETTVDTISVLEGVYTEEQAAQGDELFQVECAACHPPTEFSGRAFEVAWDDTPVWDLYQLVATTMPQDRPGSLSEEEYAAVIAYILELNRFPPGEEELSSHQDTLSAIIIEPAPDEDGDPDG